MENWCTFDSRINFFLSAILDKSMLKGLLALVINNKKLEKLLNIIRL
jgi:hypothetical protein